MSIESALIERSGNQCELCTSTNGLSALAVQPSDESAEQSLYVCAMCKHQLDEPTNMEANHWRCLNDSMWSEHPVVQVQIVRILQAIVSEGWPRDLLDMMYLEDEVKAWAESGALTDEGSDAPMDSNGVVLAAGDSVSLIKDLDVKGAGFTAKRGTLVKNISLCDVPGHVGGRVNGMQIYLKTCFLKKS